MKLRITKQKKLLENIINGLDRLFTAEELLSLARKHDKNIGIATVYRFLKDNSRHIHSYDCNRRKIYSSNANNHCHFVCKKCGKIEHFVVFDIGFIKKQINGDVCHFQVDVSGTCEKCKTG